MLYVGLTEDHKESATMFANVVGAQVISQLRATNSSVETASKRKSGWCALEQKKDLALDRHVEWKLILFHLSF